MPPSRCVSLAAIRLLTLTAWVERLRRPVLLDPRMRARLQQAHAAAERPVVLVEMPLQVRDLFEDGLGVFVGLHRTAVDRAQRTPGRGDEREDHVQRGHRSDRASQRGRERAGEPDLLVRGRGRTPRQARQSRHAAAVHPIRPDSAAAPAFQHVFVCSADPRRATVEPLSLLAGFRAPVSRRGSGRDARHPCSTVHRGLSAAGRAANRTAIRKGNRCPGRLVHRWRKRGLPAASTPRER
ncbi:hypothetical protein SAMN05421854_113103 [Amycolatopsis rubida]|uniref:Uncharacterized protein n=1 Tax=Amycolatopsis rubida TaxID=112413 RepID=A0A1I5YXU1_9PSEU|nr:hypothetical protein SAMN05421854_113103 [Amycolatopsis rubida]